MPITMKHWQHWQIFISINLSYYDQSIYKQSPFNTSWLCVHWIVSVLNKYIVCISSKLKCIACMEAIEVSSVHAIKDKFVCFFHLHCKNGIYRESHSAYWYLSSYTYLCCHIQCYIWIATSLKGNWHRELHKIFPLRKSLHKQKLCCNFLY